MVRERSDRFLQALTNLIVRLYFREVEIVGEENIPSGRPILIVANHVNALVDPLLMAGPLPLHPRFLAKSTLWHNPVLKPLLNFAGAIPVARRMDGADMSENARMFAACTGVLAGGGAIALFPEGTSHNEPSLLPLKTGVARIFLETTAAHPGIDIALVPVGLTFSQRDKFRSRALIQVGMPVSTTAWCERYRTDPEGAVRGLTEAVAGALRNVTLNYESWDQARLVERVAALVARPALEVPDELSLAQDVAFRQAVIQGYLSLRERDPKGTARVTRILREYDRLLRTFGLRDEQVGSIYPRSQIALFAFRSMWLFLIRLPLAAIGTAIHIVPFRLTRRIAMWAAEDVDDVSSLKLYVAFFSYPLLWAALALAAGWRGGVAAALFVGVMAPCSGYFALVMRDRRDVFVEEARAFFMLRKGRRLRHELVRRRELVLAEIHRLAKAWGTPIPTLQAAPSLGKSDSGPLLGSGPAPGLDQT